MYKNSCKIRLCDLISVSLSHQSLVTSHLRLLIPGDLSLLSNFKVQVSIPFPWKGKGLARAKHDDFEALLMHAIKGLYVPWIIPEPINLNPEPSNLSYYMTIEI